MDDKKICDAVFEGGGVRGVGLAGAVAALQEKGYIFARVAGSSVGAIVAALIAAGYTSSEIKEEISKLNFGQFKDKGDKFGPLGMLFSINKELGFYETVYFENWLKELLQRKKVYTFADLKIPLKVTGADVTDNKLLIFPDDLEKFGYNPQDFPVATAVRMSISIPLFFKPYILKDAEGKNHYIVDGGLLSNNPVWLFENSQHQLMNFRFVKNSLHQNKNINDKQSLTEYIKSLIGCVLDDYDRSRDGGNEKIININTVVNINGHEKEIKSTYFDITKAESEALYKNGYEAGKNFLENMQ